MLLDKIVAIVAPGRCFSCSKIGKALCDVCDNQYLDRTPSRCYRCHRHTMQFQVCTSCRRTVAISNAWVITSYDRLAKKLLHSLKFERAGYVAETIGEVMACSLPLIDKNTLVCHVPTAPRRVRLRGYDQSKLLASKLAKDKDLKFVEVFDRLTNSRQVGASRVERLQQAKNAFKIKKPAELIIKGKNILIVDDVITSGATIEFLAKECKKHGASNVSVVVFAQASDD